MWYSVILYLIPIMYVGAGMNTTSLWMHWRQRHFSNFSCCFLFPQLPQVLVSSISAYFPLYMHIFNHRVFINYVGLCWDRHMSYWEMQGKSVEPHIYLLMIFICYLQSYIVLQCVEKTLYYVQWRTLLSTFTELLIVTSTYFTF